MDANSLRSGALGSPQLPLLPLVSIVSVYYNRQDCVDESIQSLLNQTYPNLEIVVIDDGSSDRTYERLCQIKDPRLKVISTANQGFVRAIKYAISLTTGKFIAIHGSGDISLPQRIDRQLNLLQKNSEIGFVGCYIKNMYLCQNNLNEANQSHTVLLMGDESRGIDGLRAGHNPFTHGEVMFRRNVYQSVGGYRNLFKYGQDYDLWLRMAMITKFAIVKEFLYIRNVFPDGVTVRLEKLLLQVCLTDFSRQCIEQRINDGEDLIDRYGEYALFFRAKSKKLAIALWKLAVKLVYSCQLDQAGYINQLSLDEKRLISNTLLQFMIWISQKYHPFRLLMRHSIGLAVNHISSNHKIELKTWEYLNQEQGQNQGDR
ncbi:glycosyl transferase family 2 [Thalassoporum mexicanum PCC 7367]|uniref:glycosyltransferase family 2 protein n=1 Tax=Thalassoporum mexicanum TaxID=3457544 RepID=UPI00029FB0BA|nr:glycosyltransferase [Pseudanabaena sp. PCC 7367]AFY69419.1 glycosyl transferase family 2 [Pseudanabaena sp. PCC 7367]